MLFALVMNYRGRGVFRTVLSDPVLTRTDLERWSRSALEVKDIAWGDVRGNDRTVWGSWRQWHSAEEAQGN